MVKSVKCVERHEIPKMRQIPRNYYSQYSEEHSSGEITLLSRETFSKKYRVITGRLRIT